MSVEDRSSTAVDGHRVRLELSAAVADRGTKGQPAAIEARASAILQRQIENVCADLERLPLSRRRVQLVRGRRRRDAVQVPAGRQRIVR